MSHFWQTLVEWIFSRESMNEASLPPAKSDRPSVRSQWLLLSAHTAAGRSYAPCVGKRRQSGLSLRVLAEVLFKKALDFRGWID